MTHGDPEGNWEASPGLNAGGSDWRHPFNMPQIYSMEDCRRSEEVSWALVEKRELHTIELIRPIRMYAMNQLESGLPNWASGNGGTAQLMSSSGIIYFA
jgi:hypothetical protein